MTPHCIKCSTWFDFGSGKIRLAGFYWIDDLGKIRAVWTGIADGTPKRDAREFQCYDCFPKEAEDKLEELCVGY